VAKIRTNKTEINSNGEEVVLKTLELNYEFNTLVVSEVRTEDGGEVVTPVMIQPWKCLEDGSRAAFLGETDAYEWFESVKNLLT
jgi:5-formyltetrahydrofolate cyclo-ligase